MTGIYMLYSTFPNRDLALAVAKQLLDQRLIACANIHDNVTSLYRWEGKLQQEPEAVLMAKTSDEKVSPAIEAVKSLHPYEVPCIVAYPIERGNEPFLQWVSEETAT